LSSIVYVDSTQVTVEVLTATTVTVDVTYSSTEVLISNLQGPQGAVGEDFPPGGLEGQILAKATDTDYDVEWIDNYTDDLRLIVKNDSGVNILKGQAVMAVDAIGDRIRVALAVADGSVSARYMLGVASENINDGTEGYVNLLGNIGGLNTSIYTIGDVLWIDPANPGGFTTVEPVAPNIDVAVAIVTRVQQSSGRIFVRMWSQGQSLFELFDVNVTGATNGQVLTYNASTGIWNPVTPQTSEVPANRTIATTAPLQGGGDLSANRTLSIDDATTSQKGAVQLSSLTNSTSETLAATAKAVKDAYDQGSQGISDAATVASNLATHEADTTNVHGITNTANLVYTNNAGLVSSATAPVTYSSNTIAINDATTAQKGAVQLSSLTNSTSEILAATPKAVKDAYDAAIGSVQPTRTISTTAPLTGGGDLSANRTFAINDATTAQKGAVQLSSLTNSTSEILAATPKAVKDAYDLANTANTTANAAVPKTTTISTTSPLTGGGDLSANRTFAINDATTAQKGAVQLSSLVNSTSEILAATPKAVKDAYDLAAAAAPATRTISTTAPLTGGGDLYANRTFAINSATTSAAGAVQLNATVTSTSQTLAATASAVKTAYDFADEIQTRVIMEAI